MAAKRIKIGFVGAENVEEANQALGGGGPAYGNTTSQIEAIVDYVNAHGGIAGRQIVPVIRNADVMGRSGGHEAICVGFAEDDDVFAVISLSAGVDDTIPTCYAKHRTLFITSVFFAMDQSTFMSLSPYYWNSGALNLGGVARLLARALHHKKFYDGGKLGVLYTDNATFRRVYNGVLRPELSRLGVAIAADAGIAPYTGAGNLGAIQADIANAVLRFKSEGVDRVIFLDGGLKTSSQQSWSEGSCGAEQG